MAAFMLIGTTPCELRADDSITLSQDQIRIQDVVDLPCGDTDIQNISDLSVAALPASTSEVSISRDAVADLVRRRVPGLADLKVSDGQRLVTFRRAEAVKARVAPQAGCFAAVRNFAAGDLVTPDGVTETACSAGQAAARLVYDRRQSVTRAAQVIVNGEYLGRLMPLSPSGWDQGEPLKLHIQIGAVTVEREVRAIEPGSQGGRVFIRDTDGAVFGAPIDMLTKQEKPHD
ncbi:MAG TPA: hypothetical protein VGO52_06170 [Hyphomonadaceae bacterium]|nr:hypothetical protein [Hyphomonadaceae bacterium]